MAEAKCPDFTALADFVGAFPGSLGVLSSDCPNPQFIRSTGGLKQMFYGLPERVADFTGLN